MVWWRLKDTFFSQRTCFGEVWLMDGTHRKDSGQGYQELKIIYSFIRLGLICNHRTLSLTPARIFCGPQWLTVFIRLCPGGGDVRDPASPLCNSTSTTIPRLETKSCLIWVQSLPNVYLAESSELLWHCEDTLTLNMLAKHVISSLCHWNFHSKLKQSSQIWNFAFLLFFPCLWTRPLSI